jgi:hypothetical protein
MARLVKSTPYAVLEVNHLVAKKTGAIKAQHELDSTDFANIKAENGMLLVVDEVGRKVNLPKTGKEVVMLHFSAEKRYDDHKNDLGQFALSVGESYPRLYALAIGDTFTTNAVDMGTYTTETIDAAITAGAVYGTAGTDGYIHLANAPVEGAAVQLQAIKWTTMPNGDPGIKFAVIAPTPATV